MQGDTEAMIKFINIWGTFINNLSCRKNFKFGMNVTSACLHYYYIIFIFLIVDHVVRVYEMFSLKLDLFLNCADFLL